jgi:Uncharacterized protein conserved in bacteria (DUF2147)
VASPRLSCPCWSVPDRRSPIPKASGWRRMAPTCEWDPAAPRCAQPSPNRNHRSIRKPAFPGLTKNNPDPAHRGRPLIGVPVLYGLVPDGPGHWSGRLYNIDNGNSYAGHLLEIDPRTIRVEGCAIGICGGQNMTRIK